MDPENDSGALDIDSAAAAIFESEFGAGEGADGGEAAPRDERGRFQARGETGDSEATGDPQADGDEDGAEDDAEEDGETGDEQAAEPRYKVTIDGAESEVPLSELVSGYQRQADYTRKTQEVAQQRREVEEVRARVNHERGAQAQLAQAMMGYIESQLPSEDDILALMAEDPVTGFRQRAIRDKLLEDAKQFRTVYEQLLQGSQRETAEERQRQIRAAFEALPQMIPAWSNPDTAKAELREIEQAMLTQWGFRPEELQSIVDPRALNVARYAVIGMKLSAKADELRQPNPRPTPAPAREGAPRSLQPGGKSLPADRQGVGRAQAMSRRARESGRLDDVTALLLATEFKR